MVRNYLRKEEKQMSKKEKQFYCKVGQAVCNIAGALLFFAVPITLSGLAEFICNIIL